ncbi:putative ribonuclease H-like domain-containing protein [Tanacetum coccineum]
MAGGVRGAGTMGMGGTEEGVFFIIYGGEFVIVLMFCNGCGLEICWDAVSGKDSDGGFERYFIDSAINVLAGWNVVYDAHNDVACLMLGSMTPELHIQFENSSPYEILQELKSMFKKQVGVERFDLIQIFYACKHEEGKPVGAYVLKMKGYVEQQLERLGYMLPQDLISAMFILNGLTKDFARFGKANGKGKDKQVYIPKPKNPKPSAKEHPAKDDTCHHCKEVGHWKRNCHVYIWRRLVEKIRSKVRHMPRTLQGFREARKLKQGALYVGKYIVKDLILEGNLSRMETPRREFQLERMVFRILPPVTAAEIQAVEKIEGNMGSLRSSLEEMANSKKMQKAVFKQRLRFTISVQKEKERLILSIPRSWKAREESDGLLTMDDGIVNWGEHTEDEETNHALMAISSSSEENWNESCKRKGTIAENIRFMEDSSKNLWRLCLISGMRLTNSKVGLGYERQSNIEVLSYEEEMNFFVIKGTPEPDPSLPDDRSKVTIEVYVSTLTSTNEKGVSAPKSKEVEPSLWTNTNRINHANQFVPRPVQLKTGRPNINSVRTNINTGRTNINSVRSRVNTVTTNVNTVRSRQPVPTRTSNSFSPQRPPSQMSHSHAVKGNWGSVVKTSAGYNWRNSKPNSNCDSGPTFIRTVNAKGPQGRPKPVKAWVPKRNINDISFSRCRIQSTKENMDFEEFNGGSVTFGGSKGYITGKGKIRVGNLDFDSVYFVKELGHFNLFSISQICNKQHKVLFTKTKCLVVSSDFKMPNENQILLKVPRHHNMYSFDMKTPSLIKDYACLIAKATCDESKLWHRRLGHIDFKNINKLVKGNLVRGLPSKVFKNDHTCVAYHKGKQHRASCKAKLERLITEPLHTLHMDLFGPTSVKSINHASYCLVITDDCTRFSWVFFLASKDETSGILQNFIRQIENQLNHRVKIIRSDNGTEFKNRDMLEFYGNKGIKQEYSNARTPQQNGVAERMNRTLIEAARTMLADSLLPTTFWAEAVSTACYIFNRVRVTKPQNKTPYELLFGHKPIISYIRPFGCHVTILDTLSVLGKFDGKSDEGFLVGYSLNSKAYRVYNLVTKRVEVNLHVNFLEDKPNVKGVGYRWMFDIDYLTDSMNYIPVSLENQANPHAGASEVTNSAGTSQTPSFNASEEKDEDVELIVVPSTVRNTEEKAESRKSSTNSKKEEILIELLLTLQKIILRF